MPILKLSRRSSGFLSNSALRARSVALPLVCLAMGLASCAAPPPPPTTVDVAITATLDVNPGPDGAGAPVALRVYQLKSSAGFKAAEFFALLEKDVAVLKNDIVQRDDYLLSPGDSKTVSITMEDRAKSIAVFAAYRNYATAAWRGTVDPKPHAANRITVEAGKAGVTVKLVP